MAEGKVYLDGAGPGDPGLLTLRRRECLLQADEVVYDGLVNPLLLRLTKAHATRTSRVDGPTGRRLDQEEINTLLIALAREGKCVVRLKGGDPYIFGRGAEEAEALLKAGIEFEVVPGVTAATAVTAYAGISLTHREDASAVAYVTGHEDPTKPHSALDYETLARFPGTLVFYMGLHRLPEITAALISAGLSPSTPAAVISRGATSRQRTVTASLESLPEKVTAARLRPPSLIVIGSCVMRHERLAWFEAKPLLGQRIGITRPDAQSEPQIARAIELGAEPVLMPTIRIEPMQDWTTVDKTLDRLTDYDWLVFTSVNGVRSVLDRLWQTGRDARSLATIKLAGIGPSTAEALNEYQLRADVVPDEYRAEALAEVLRDQVAGKRVLWARASRGRNILPRELRSAGAVVDELIVYRNEDVESLPPSVVDALRAGDMNWIGLSSPSIARQLAQLIPADARSHLGKSTKLVAISPVTQAAAEEAGLPVSTTATSFTWDGIFEAILAAEEPGSSTFHKH